jgi:hypothetical protein
MYFNTSFYDVYCKGVRSQSHMNVLSYFVWLLILNISDDGLIEKPKIVTRTYVKSSCA